MRRLAEGMGVHFAGRNIFRGDMGRIKRGGGKPRPYNTTASQADSFYLANHCDFCASVPACNLARPSAIAPATFVSAVCRATRRAFLIPLASERPCEMMAEPLTPSSGAPPYSA